MAHAPVFADQVQVSKGCPRFHVGGDFRAVPEKIPVFLIEIGFKGELLTGGCVEVDQPLLVEELPNLLPVTSAGCLNPPRMKNLPPKE